MRTEQELVNAYRDAVLERWYMEHCTAVREDCYRDQTPEQVAKYGSMAARIENLFGSELIDRCKRDDTKNEYRLEGIQDGLRWALGGDWWGVFQSPHANALLLEGEKPKVVEDEETDYVLRALEARERNADVFKPVHHEWFYPFSAATERAIRASEEHN